MLTNGHYLNDNSGDLRKFELIHTYTINGVEFSWVKAFNGNYKDELLTFKSEDLYVCL